MYKTRIEKLQLDNLVPFPENPQEVPTEKMALITKNMKKRGWTGEWATVWQDNGNAYIISGNHRVEAAISAGIKEHECIIIDDSSYSWEQAKKDCIMYNSLRGEPDEEKLRDFIGNLVTDFSLDIEDVSVDIGMDVIEISDLLNEQKINEKEVDENIETEYTCPKCGYSWS